ncbi:hypothetical protein CAP40_07280 [Sphingomonas sp. IBVSS2]|uniref:hypothetical protein n=1 Tax=Sphingomonas sp. IBVSS2 TaxID=1985172 RepID=UPI000A2D71CC|nr:hypothetical protein [Sphingomonas sp. IBVSS2]OSZ68382.1 hypothetical protein CAP40_07280 [Sphingomonas sp. IBVSS2]
MRILGRAAAVAALVSLAAVPALAASETSASKLSLRGATSSKHKSDIAGAPIIAIIGVVAIVAGGVIIATQDDKPDSP